MNREQSLELIEAVEMLARTLARDSGVTSTAAYQEVIKKCLELEMKVRTSE